MEIKEMVKLVCHALDEKKAEDIKVIDIKGLSVMADYFIVASGGSQNQLLAMQNEVDKEMYEHGIHAKQVEGNRSSTWILMDYEDVFSCVAASETILITIAASIDCFFL